MEHTNTDQIVHKTRLNNSGYCILLEYLTKEQLTKIQEDLTVAPKVLDATPEEIEKLKYAVYSYSEDGLSIIVPRYYGVSRFGKPDTTDFDEAEEVDMKFVKTLRPKQQSVVDLCIRYMCQNGGGLLSVPCGFGKTICALYIAQKLGLKTLVVVHKSFLLNQWIDRALEFLNIQRSNIGIIKQGKCEIAGKDLVIGIIQTMSRRQYNELYRQFGLVIFDEAHHVAAKFFSKTLMKTSSTYTLALTATPYRNDGLIKVMYWFTGGTIYREKIKMNINVVVKSIQHRSTDKTYFKECMRWFNGKMRPYSQKMAWNLMKIESRNNAIVQMTNHLRKAYPERKMLILSEKIDHLRLLKKRVDDLIKADVDAGLIDADDVYTCYYIGETKPADRQEAEERGDIIFATYQMANEGLDIGHLNTLIFASPKKDIVQSVGRIMRKILGAGDVRPLIIDIQDDLSVLTKWNSLRNDYYAKCMYKVEEYYLEDGSFMSENKFFDVDDIKDEDRPVHSRSMEIHKLINQANRDYTSFVADAKRIRMLEHVRSHEKAYGLDLSDIQVYPDFTPFRVKDILAVDRLTESDFTSTVLKEADVDAAIDIDKDIALDPEDLDTGANMNINNDVYKEKVEQELLKYKGTDDSKKMKSLDLKLKKKRLV